jgi:hypothetical protein
LNFKIAVLDYVKEYEKGKTGKHKGGSRAAADEFNINPSSVSAWMKNETEIRREAAAGRGKKGRGYRGTVRFRKRKDERTPFPLAEDVVVNKFHEARGRGARVGPTIVKTWMKAAVMQHYPSATFKATAGWFANFKRRNNLVTRCVTNKKKVSVAQRLPQIKRFHKRWQRVVDAQEDDPLTGFIPACLLNADQTPLCLMESELVTLEARGATTVRIATQESSDKRFCTLQIMIALDGTPDAPVAQPRMAIIFRGTGARITDQERSMWNPSVDVYFQPNAWMDSERQVEWVERTVRPFVATLPPHATKVLFVDNLSSQTDDTFLEAIRAAGIHHRRLFPAGCTDIIQPLDQHFNRTLKRKIGDLLDQKLVGDKAFQTAWLGLEETLPAWKRRAMVTHLVQAAYEDVIATFDFRKLGFSTGTVMVKTGMSSPHPIKIPEVEGYTFDDVALPEDTLQPAPSSSSSAAAPVPQPNAVAEEEDAGPPDETEAESASISSDSPVSDDSGEDSDANTLAPHEDEVVFNHHVVDEMVADDTAVFETGDAPASPPPGYAYGERPTRMPAPSLKRHVLWAVPVTNAGSPGWIVSQIDGGPADPTERLSGISYRLKCSSALDSNTPQCFLGKNNVAAVAFTLENYGTRWMLLDKAR